VEFTQLLDARFVQVKRQLYRKLQFHKIRYRSRGQNINGKKAAQNNEAIHVEKDQGSADQ